MVSIKTFSYGINEGHIDGLVQDCSISIAGDTAVLHWAIDMKLLAREVGI